MKIKTRRYYIYYMLKCGLFLVKIIPSRVMCFIADIFARIAFALIERQRRPALNNLRAAFPEKSDSAIRRLGSNVFANMASNFVDLIHVAKLNADQMDRYVRPHGLEKIEAVLKEGTGAIVLTAHFGSWELVGAYMRIKGFDGATIVRKIYFKKYDKLMRRIRSIYAMDTIYRDESPKKMLKVLRDNKILGMLADQDIESIDGVFVDFFKKKAYTPTAPAKIARASGAPIIPCYMLRSGSVYDYYVDDPIYVEHDGDKDQAILNATQLWTAVLESYIRRFPDQWVWMHKRWKTRPEGETCQSALA